MDLFSADHQPVLRRNANNYPLSNFRYIMICIFVCDMSRTFNVNSFSAIDIFNVNIFRIEQFISNCQFVEELGTIEYLFLFISANRLICTKLGQLSFFVVSVNLMNVLLGNSEMQLVDT